jgi:ABC-type multidrug transport system fused ATPase/permease subunit
MKNKNNNNDDHEDKFNPFLFFLENAFTNTVIEQILLDLFITDDISSNDKYMFKIFIKSHKDNDFKVIKMMNLVIFISTIKKLIDTTQYNSFKTAFTIKCLNYIITRALRSKYISYFRKDENELLDYVTSYSFEKFSSKINHRLLKSIENNEECDISLKYIYQNSSDKLLQVHKILICVVHEYIKILNNNVTLFLVPFLFENQLNIGTFNKIIFINIYSAIIFRSIYKKTKIDQNKIKKETDEGFEKSVDCFFNNSERIYQKDTTKQEFKSINDKLMNFVNNNFRKEAYRMRTYSNDIVKQYNIMEFVNIFSSTLINNSILLLASDKNAIFFERYAFEISEAKVNVKLLNNFIENLKTKPYKIANTISWNKDDNHEYLFILNNVSLEYFDINITVNVLENINLKFEMGKVHYIHGESGCGKTTLLNSLIKRNKIKNGTIQFLGLYDVYTYFSIRKYIIYMTSKSGLFEKSIHYNITYGMTKQKLKENEVEIEDAIIKYMNILNLQEFIPHIKTSKATKLSQGQIQRVCIIGMFIDILFNDARMLILDEFTSNLDAENEKLVFSELIKLQEIHRFTIFYTSHTLSNMVYSDYNYPVNHDTLSISKQVTNKQIK